MDFEISLLTVAIFIFGGISIILSRMHDDESSRGFSVLTMALIFLSALLILVKNPITVLVLMFSYTLFVIIYGRKQYYDVKVTRKFIETDEVSHNFKAIFLTDFQFDIKKTKFNHKAYDNVIKMCGEIDYDMILLGGDYINYAENIDNITSGLNKIKKPQYGTFACIGNHDYIDAELLAQKFSENDINLLINESYNVSDEIVITGIDDYWKGKPVVMPLVEPKLNIVLAHNPNYIEMLDENSNIDMMLCGHYHAGQVNFIGISFQRLVTRYTHGWYQEKNINMYVSSGIGGNVFRGLVGFHIRYFARPEIVEIVFVGNKHNEERK